MKTNYIVIILLLLIMENSKAQNVFGRFEYKSQIFYGELLGDSITPLDKAPWLGGINIGDKIALGEVEILHPSEPKVIIGLGNSYRSSWVDKEPFNTVRWFLKPPSAAASPNDTVFIPHVVDALKVEVELAIVIGKTVKNASEELANEAIFGYTIGNDIVGWTDSYYEKEGERKDQNDPLLGPGLKIGDRFAPFGPFIYTGFDWENKKKTLQIIDHTGKEMVNTSHNTSELIYDPAKIVSHLSKVLTLSPGDVILTGTNKSYVVTSGHTVKIAIEGLGSISNKIE
jgi:2-keto-4-pentenoate hydratase/2-oxohepta-3-ene-1,7-dioic acid hydratase in catechol pathway